MAFNSYRKTGLCIYFRSIFIFFFFLSPSRVEVKQNIRFPFLPGSPVYLRIQSADMKPVTQIEQASAHVVVLSLGIQAPLALLQGDLPGFIYQQRADLLPPVRPAHLQVIQVQISKEPRLQHGQPNAFFVLIGAQKTLSFISS